MLDRQYSIICRFFSVIVFLCALACWPQTNAAERFESNGFSYQIDQIPGWTVPSPQPIHARSRNESDTRTLLNDVQVNLFNHQPERYIRSQTTALQRSGLEKISQIYIAFNPAYETLTLHDIAVIRGGQRINRLKDAKVEMLRREQQLESKLLDGEVTALIVLSDIRMGDVIDLAYTTQGANPAFTNQFTMNFALNRTEAIGALRLRVIYPFSHQLNYKLINSNLAPTLSKNAAGQVLEIARENVAAIKMEEDVPVWHDMFEWIHLSEYKNWQDVNQWALKHFALADKPGAALEKVIREIAARYRTPKERAAAALSFVQNEIRYFGIEIGASSHVPKQPEQTLLDRFGDCKDKSMLLTAMLRRLGITAAPALVSAGRMRGVADRLPSPYSFDHVITQAVIGDTVYWLDGTLRYQGADIDTLGFTPYGKALVIRPDTKDLTDVALPAGYANRSQHIETFDVRDFNKPIAVTIRQIHQRQFAEYVRLLLNTNGPDAIQKDMHDSYLRIYPNLVVTEALEIRDDPQRNTIEVIAHFELPDYLEYANGKMRLENSLPALIDLATPPRQLARKFPLAMSFPAQIDHRFELIWPDKINIKHPLPKSETDQFLSFSKRYEIKNNQLVLEESVRTAQDAVMPQAMPRYIERLRKLRADLGMSLGLNLFDVASFTQRFAESTRSHASLAEDGLEKLWHKQIATRLISDDLIASNKLASKLLAVVYLDRALANNWLGENRNARADIEAALKLDPASIAIKKAHAEILTAGGKFKDALTAIDAVKVLDANEESFSLRAKNLFMLGKFKDAEDIFSNSIRAASTVEASQYDLLWLALARVRGGAPVDDTMKGLATQTGLSAEVWPGQIWQAILGVTSAEQALRDASSDLNEARLRRTEVLFYLGQLALARNETKNARAAFQQVMTIGATMYWEHSLARIELERLD